MRANIKILATESLGYNELTHHKPRFDEGCSKLLDQRKQAKLQWLRDPSEINVDNLNMKPAGISGIKKKTISERSN
jgi:hypothetical protein